MRSTFHGLETARRGMYTQQSALMTTGHNIANANTPGFSRQRINFVGTEPYPAAARNRPEVPGQMGTGVKAGSVQRIREGFLDVQFRGENNKFGYWNAKSEALEKMEDIMNEPSENGLSKTLDRFWQSLQDLSVNPEDSGARSVVRQRGIAVAETFNYLSNSLTTIQSDIKSQAEMSVQEINSLASQINNINLQIKEVEPHGYLPNDLYDERDNLMDKLSQLVNVQKTKQESGGQALKIAEGMYKVEIVDKDGNAFTLVDTGANPSVLNPVSVNYGANGYADSVSVGGSQITVAGLSGGTLKGQLESFGYNEGGAVKGEYHEMLASLDEMAYYFANSFNDAHSVGWSIDSIKSGMKTSYQFFDGLAGGPAGAAKDLKLHIDMDNLDHIAAAKSPYSGDGSNALTLSDVKNNDLPFSSGATSLQSYYEGRIGKMAVATQQAVRLTHNSQVLAEAVEQRRTSISGVSIDEEMTNMIQFQHAYNAAARSITVVDEMLDKIINGMGVGGR
ncbi:flagellar hook-associated protein FlgK [Fictibacillus aquaticus]|uniref:Flagellar hook-associated protein 1 n=1 Tax=Fictibacillus aquaticus TaxID=2021314 RepID=A0A235FEE1_9BACL|nr:flagellar hook-associated protein FlgK [Fictibacillus aquaticus]OYD59746.1 flagellar hook-associated protein FlgK [Fictibacillus aquaticus]